MQEYMVKDKFSIRLKEARLMMGFSMDKLVERTVLKVIATRSTTPLQYGQTCGAHWWRHYQAEYIPL